MCNEQDGEAELPGSLSSSGRQWAAEAVQSSKDFDSRFLMNFVHDFNYGLSLKWKQLQNLSIVIYQSH